MSIGSLSLGPLVQSIFGGGKAAEAKPAEPAAEAKTAAEKPSAASALEIAADYDVRHITPGQFSSLLNELRAAGHLSDDDFNQLSALRQEVEKAGHAADEPFDLLEFVRERLTAQQALAEQAAQGAPQRLQELQEGLAQMRQRVGWLEKLDALHRRDLDTFNLDAVA